MDDTPEQPRVALVTGGATGIGRATVLQLACDGARVVVADIDAAGAAETTRLATAAGGTARAVTADVTSPSDCEAMVAAAVDAFGGLDIAVNNAGMSGAPAGIVDCTFEQWDQTLALNLTSVFASMKAEIPALLSRGGGTIVNVASGAGLRAFPALPAYVASKHGVVGLTKSAALELARSGIRVNCVCPGTTRTPMIEGFLEAAPEMEKMLAASSPVRRMADPEEIAAAIVWLCSPAAGYVSGVALPVDAGATV